MELIIRKTIGKQVYSFVCSGKNLHDCVMEAEKLSFGDVPKCGLCGNENLVLRAYMTKEGGFRYTKIECLACRGGLTFGQQKKDPDTFYLRKTEDGKPEWIKPEKKEGK